MKEKEKKSERKLDIMGRYNTIGVNNTEAIGYDNLVDRLEMQNEDVNRDLAHESVFDKFLADYFLEKRGEYNKSKELIE
jgi:hypothetical protein